jgi:cell division septum initiation protein DivIVA
MPEDEKMITVKEADYQGLLAKNVSQSTQIEQLKQQLKDSTEALTVIKTRMDAAEKEEKDAVIDELVRDSQGKLARETLQDHDLKDLYFLKDTLDRAQPKTFVSVMRQREADTKKPVVMGTVGTYNQATGKYEGGMAE